MLLALNNVTERRERVWNAGQLRHSFVNEINVNPSDPVVWILISNSSRTLFPFPLRDRLGREEITFQVDFGAFFGGKQLLTIGQVL